MEFLPLSDMESSFSP